MAFTEKDNRIVKEWFEPYHHAWIKHIEKVFYRDNIYSYDQARNRLKAIMNEGYIKINHDVTTNRNIYMLDKSKINMPTMHRMIALDVLAELHYNSFKVEHFSTDHHWMNSKIQSDAFMVFTVGNLGRFHYFVEVQRANHDPNLEKYDILRESGEVQDFLGKQLFPRILYISDRQTKDLKVKSTKVVQLDSKLHLFPSILL